VPQQADDWQRCSITQRAYGVALDLLRDLLQHVYLLQGRVSVHHARQDVVQPACALTAGRALAAALNL
jgi:hypothetical protein